MTSLPTHRHLLTTLITSLSSTSPSTTTTEAPPVTPLRALSQDHRQLLLTLHVLFPNLLLPAFDLLDRRLVTRLTLRGESEGGRDDLAGGTFLVRSLATTLTRRHRDVGFSSQRYLVQLGTWQCACPSFTFDAFPVSTGTAVDYEAEDSSLDEKEKASEWSFGGMSLDGLGASGGDVPCCKHLLACLIVEKWSGLLGSYVEERIVSREEMAGIVADM